MSQALGVGELGENRLNFRQIHALDTMYNSHPAIQAARTVLHSRLLGGGVTLLRDGKPAPVVKFGETGSDGIRKKGVTERWAMHLEEVWLPFARDVIDSFLKFGFCAVVFDTDGVAPEREEAIRKMKSEAGLPTRKRTAPTTPLLVPKVPLLGTYEIAWRPHGRYGYAREYMLYSTAPGYAAQVDYEASIHIRQHPDASGNVNSPIAAVYDMGSFVTALTELAFTAEITRSQPSIVTQLRRETKTNTLDPGALFFDTDAQGVEAAQADKDDSTSAARALEMQAQLCKIINNLQTRASVTPNAPGTSRGAFQAPEVPPRLFVLPKEHELAPNVQVPQPRGDLEALQRLAIDQFSAAMGVPAALVFEGRFSNNSTTQLQLLNSTVAQLAKSVNQVLTAAYNTLYADDDDDAEAPAQLRLQTAPLSATQELTQLFSAGIVDLESALPAALNSLGASADEVNQAQERAKKRQEAVEAASAEGATQMQAQAATSTPKNTDGAASRPASEAGDERA